MKKKFISCFFAVSVLVILLSCKGKSQTGNEKNLFPETDFSGPVIGFSIDTLALERWQRDLDTFISTAANLGAEVIVQNSGNNSAEQNRQLLYLASQNVDCVVVLPAESKPIKEGLEKLKNLNIPVISYDRLILDADISLYMTIDSEQVGYLMGSKMRALTPQTSWALILGSPDDYNMEMVGKGLWKALKSSEIVICDTFYTSGWNYDLSRQHAFDLITGGIIPDAIICGNDAVAESVIGVIDTHVKKHIPICGQDADIVACQNIVKGKQDFTIYKPITRLAEMAAECAVKLAKGTPVENLISDETTYMDNHFKKVPSILLEPLIVDKNNMNSIIIDSGFHTYNEIYE